MEHRFGRAGPVRLATLARPRRAAVPSEAINFEMRISSPVPSYGKLV
jgi:hypothetical protein